MAIGRIRYLEVEFDPIRVGPGEVPVTIPCDKCLCMDYDNGCKATFTRSRRGKLLYFCDYCQTEYAVVLPPEWQDESRTWVTVEQVYECRYDCKIMPEGVRLAA